MKFLILATFRVERVIQYTAATFQDDMDSAYKVAEAMFTQPNLFEYVYGRVSGGWVGVMEATSHEEIWNILSKDKTFFSLFEWHIEPLMEAQLAEEEDKEKDETPKKRLFSVDKKYLPKLFPSFMRSGGWS